MAFQDEFQSLLNKGKEFASDALRESARLQVEAGKADPKDLERAAAAGINLGPKPLIGEEIKPVTEQPVATYRPTPGLPGVEKKVDERLIPKAIDSFNRFLFPILSTVIPFNEPDSPGGSFATRPNFPQPTTLEELKHHPDTIFPQAAEEIAPGSKQIAQGPKGDTFLQEQTPFAQEMGKMEQSRRLTEVAGIIDPFAGKGKVGKKGAEDIAGLAKKVKALIDEAPEHMRGFLVEHSDNAERWIEMTEKVAEIKKTKGFNLENLNAVDEESIIAAQNLPDKLTLTTEEVAKLVEDSKLTSNDLANFADIYATNPAAFQVSTEMQAVGNKLLKENVEQVSQIKQKMILEPNNEDLATDLANAITEKWEIMAGKQAFGSTAGRALQAQKVGGVQEDLRKGTSKLLRSLGKEDGIKLLTLLEEAGDNPDDVVKIITQFTTANHKDKLIEYIINGMLSKPTTHLKNLAGNALNLTSLMLRTPIEVGFDTVRSFATGSERSVFLSEIPAAIKGFQKGDKVARKQLAEDLIKFGTGRGSEIPHVKTEEFAHLPKIGTQFDSSTMASAGGKAVRIPTDVLKMEDRYFRAIAEETLKARYDAKLAKGFDLTPRQREKFIDDKVAELLFQTNLKDRPFNKILPQFQGMINDSPVLKALFPFYKTPLNLFFEGLKHSPAGFLDLMFRGLSGGKIKGLSGGLKGKQALTETASDFAKATLGTAITMPFMNFSSGLNEKGLPNMTGPLPTDRKERRDFFDRGLQPWSIYHNGEYKSYKDMEPFATSLAMLAAFGQQQRETGEINLDLAQAFATTVAQSFADKSSMKTLGDVVDLMTGLGQEDVSGGQEVGEFIAERSKMLIPNWIQGVARGADPLIRDPSTDIEGFIDVPGFLQATVNQLMSVTPGLSQNLPAKPGKEGLPIQRSQGIVGQLFDPFPSTAPEINSHDEEFMNIDWSPPLISQTVDKVKLDPEAFSVYSFLVGQTRKKWYDSVINSEDYQAASNKGREDKLKKATTNASKQAKSLFLLHINDFQGWTRQDKKDYLKMYMDSQTDSVGNPITPEVKAERTKIIESFLNEPLFLQSVEGNRKNTEAVLFEAAKEDPMALTASTNELKDMVTDHYDELIQKLLTPLPQ